MDIFQTIGGNIGDAVFAVSDYYAIELMHFLQKHGVIIPRDIKIAGFDDNPICQNVYPTLTTIHQDGRLRAKEAIQLLCQMRNGAEEGRTVETPIELIIREST